MKALDTQYCHPLPVHEHATNTNCETPVNKKVFFVILDLARHLGEIGRKSVIVSRKEDHVSGHELQAVIAEKVQTVAESSFTKSPKAQQQVVWNITTALIALINALATARDEILDAIASNPQILPFLCFLITHTSTPYETSTEALSCLMSLSEDNLKVSQLVLADPSNEDVHDLGVLPYLLRRVGGCGREVESGGVGAPCHVVGR